MTDFEIQQINEFDDLQEKVIDICTRLISLENEADLYKCFDIDGYTQGACKDIEKEKETLLEQKEALEEQMSKIDIELYLGELQ